MRDNKHKEKVSEYLQFLEQLRRLKQHIILRDSRINSSLSIFDLANVLRDHVYHRILFAPSDGINVVPWSFPAELYLAAVDRGLPFIQSGSQVMNHAQDYVSLYQQGEYLGPRILPASFAHICGDLSILYACLLRAFAIPARFVFMMNTICGEAEEFDRFMTHDYHSHVSVEFYDSARSKWLASSPTFNVMFQDPNGQYCDWELARTLIQEDPSLLTITSNNFSLITSWFPCRILQNYYVELRQLSKYLLVGPYKDAQGQICASRMLPETWNGLCCDRDGNLMGDFTKFTMLQPYCAIVLEDYETV
jgi:hypothetical protein